MSDNWLQLIPTDPRFQPPPETAELGRTLLASFAPQSDKVSALFTSRVQFFHPMANWSGVACTACGADAEPWWDAAMERAAAKNFDDLVVSAPCCGAKVSLNELRYHWPAAFGSFALEAMNPNITDLTLPQEEALSEVIGQRLRKVWVHI